MIARLFIGCIGACFVVTQMWTSLMFAQTIIGTANATSAGWGNLGAGVAQGLMPAIFMGFKNNGYDNNDAWRSTLFVPGGICCIVGFMVYLLGSDCPQGNYQQLRRQGENHGIPMLHSLRLAVGDPRTWLLHLHYAVCFGFELAVNGNLALHFHNVFDFSQTTAGAAAAAFGMMNIFARTMGGALSDICSKQFGLVRGRVCSLFVCLVFEGVFLVLFSRVRRGEWGGFGTAMVFMVMFSCCVQMAEGCTFALVPFVNPTAIGGVAGIVGAGGSVGAVSANTLFLNGSNTAFLVMGFICLAVSFTVPLLLFFKFREN